MIVAGVLEIVVGAAVMREGVAVMMQSAVTR